MPPRNAFEEMDRRAARAVGRLLEEPAIWRPMLVRVQGGGLTIDQQAGPDPARPVRLDLVAIPTWKPTTGDLGGDKGGQQVATAQVVLDFEREAFAEGIPRKGDRIELPRQNPGERVMEITRVMDDGSSRILFAAQVVKP